MDVLKESILGMCRMRLDLEIVDMKNKDEMRFFITEHLKNAHLFKLQGQCKSVTSYESIRDFAGYSLDFYHPIKLQLCVPNKYVHDKLEVNDCEYVLSTSPCNDQSWIKSQLSGALSRIHLLEMASIKKTAEMALEKENSFLKLGRFIKRMTKKSDVVEKETSDCLFICGDFAAAKNGYQSYRGPNGPGLYCNEMSMYCSMLLGKEPELQWTSNPKLINTESHVRVLYFLIEYYKVTKRAVPGHVLMLYLQVSSKKYAACKSFFTLELVEVVTKKRRLFLSSIVDAMRYFNENNMRKNSEACWRYMLKFKEVLACSLQMESQDLDPGHMINNEGCKQSMGGFINERVIMYISKLKQDMLSIANISQKLQ